MSGKIDLNNEKANMYGCLPCPKCGSEYRWAETPDKGPTKKAKVMCECGFEEPVENPEVFGL